MVSLSNHGRLWVSALIVVLACWSCGKKGPPLPPLLKLPVAPTEFLAERHGSTVDIQLRVPTANTDGTKPSNIERVDIYGFTGPEVPDNDQVIKFATKVGTVDVKAPRDPNQTVDEDEEEDVELTGSGLDQGAYAHVSEHVTAETQRPLVVVKTERVKTPKPVVQEDAARPLVPTMLTLPSRTYVAVGVSTRGKPGRFSERVRISLIHPPPTLAAPQIAYDEKAVTVDWTPLPTIGGGAPTLPERGGVLPSTPIGMMVPEITYNVYEVSNAAAPTLTRLTGAAVRQPRFVDARITWGEERCYAVRALVTIDGASLEGMESPPTCVTLTDIFPPAAPTGVQAVPSDGAISLIWDPNPDKDIRGYFVLRGPATSATLERVTPEPIPETSFQDRVRPGVRFVYAVQAVDAAGNVSPMSAKVEETAR